MKNSTIILMSILLLGCTAIATGDKSAKIKTVVLDFENCSPEAQGYRQVSVLAPGGFKRKRVNDYHGYCEYQLKYRDGSIFYLSTHIYSGSSLNFANRMAIGINAYAPRSLNDTIRNAAQQTDGRYWLEYILGDVVVGYYNVPAEKKSGFDKAIATLKRKK